MKKVISLILMLCLLVPAALAQMPVATDEPVYDPILGTWQPVSTFNAKGTKVSTSAEAELTMTLTFTANGRVTLHDGEAMRTAEWVWDEKPYDIDDSDLEAPRVTISYNGGEMRMFLMNDRLFYKNKSQYTVFSQDTAIVPAMNTEAVLDDFLGEWTLSYMDFLGTRFELTEKEAREKKYIDTLLPAISIQPGELSSALKLDEKNYEGLPVEGGILHFLKAENEPYEAGFMLMLEDGCMMFYNGIVNACYVRAEVVAAEAAAEAAVEAEAAVVEE